MIAQRPVLAERLVSALRAPVQDPQVQLAVPDADEAGLRLDARFGLTGSFGCTRIYHGGAPRIEVGSVFDVTSFEFG